MNRPALSLCLGGEAPAMVSLGLDHTEGRPCNAGFG